MGIRDLHFEEEKKNFIELTFTDDSLQEQEHGHFLSPSRAQGSAGLERRRAFFNYVDKILAFVDRLPVEICEGIPLLLKASYK